MNSLHLKVCNNKIPSKLLKCFANFECIYLEAIWILTRKANFFLKKSFLSERNIFKTFVPPLKPIVLSPGEGMRSPTEGKRL